MERGDWLVLEGGEGEKLAPTKKNSGNIPNSFFIFIFIFHLPLNPGGGGTEEPGGGLALSIPQYTKAG